MSKPRLSLLGGFDLRDPQGDAQALPTRKSAALAAILAIETAPVSRDRLLGLLWADRGEDQARHSLSQALTGLRRVFGAAVFATRETVALDRTAIDIDAMAFHDAAGRTEEGQLTHAAALYRGPLLHDFELTEPAFTDWLSAARTRFANRAGAALLRLAALQTARADEAAAIATLSQALEVDPCSEPAHLALMRLHLDHGRPAACLRHYAACAISLRTELDAAPSEAIEALRQEARRRDASEPARVPAPAQSGERKHASALALALWPTAGVDPEEAQAVLQAASNAAAGVVREAGGQVIHASAEGLQAVFGIPTALEDHATRACRAALAIQQRLDVPTYRDATARIAVDSGELVLRGEAGVFGPALQRATRIAALPNCPPVVVAEIVRDLTRARFAFAPHDRVVLAPGEPAMPLFVPTGAAEPQPAPRGGFVGRAIEFALLRSASDDAAHGQGRLVAVMGEAGIGKSRLVREFLATALPAGWRVLQAGADPYFAEAAYYPVQALLRHFFGLADTVAPVGIRTRVETALARLGAQYAGLAAPLLSLLDCEPEDPGWTDLEPRMRSRRLVQAVIQLLHRQSEDTPLLIVVEDLHWLDSASRALLEELADSLASARMLLLVNFRPEFGPGWAAAWSGRSHYRAIRIDRLPDEAASSLLDTLLGVGPALAAVKAQLAARSGGNPFFLEECVRALGQSGSFEAASLPETVHAVIGARLDRLAPEDKRLLQVASVLGTEISCSLLAEIAGYDDVALEAALRRLQAEEFLLPVRVLPDRQLRFKHALTHEVVTASLLRQQRQTLHAGVLAALETAQADNLDLLAHHAHHAADWPRTARYASEAGRRAAMRNANRQTIGHLSRAMAATAHLPATPARDAAEIDLRLALRDAMFVFGDTAGIPGLLAGAIDLAGQIGDSTRLGEAKLLLSGWHWSAGQHRQALAVAEEAGALAHAQGAVLLEALSQYRRGISLNALGAYAAAVAALRAAMAQLDAAGLRDTPALGGYPWVFCCNFLTWSLAELGEFDAARDIGRQGWEAAWTRPNFYTRSVMTFGYGHTLVRAGDHEAAREVLESGLALFDANDLLATFPFIAAPLGYLLVATGEVGSGLAQLSRATEPATRRMAPAYAHVDLWHADAALLAGHFATAEAAARRGLAAAEAQHEAGHAAWAHRSLGDILSLTDPATAAAHYRSALALAARQGMVPLQTEATRGLAAISAESHM